MLKNARSRSSWKTGKSARPWRDTQTVSFTDFTHPGGVYGAMTPEQALARLNSYVTAPSGAMWIVAVVQRGSLTGRHHIQGLAWSQNVLSLPLWRSALALSHGLLEPTMSIDSSLRYIREGTTNVSTVRELGKYGDLSGFQVLIKTPTDAAIVEKARSQLKALMERKI